MDAQFLLVEKLVIVFAIAGVTVWAFAKFKIPPLLGFLLAGVVTGPAGLGILHDRHEIEGLAEAGVVLLLFTIGLEFSLKDLIRMGSVVFAGGTLQLALTGATFALIGVALGEPTNTAVFVGLALAVSSTAIVLRLLGERNELSSPHGRVSLGILLLQDLAVVVLMLLVPVLAGRGVSRSELIIGFFASLGSVVALYLAAKIVLPFILARAARSQSRDLFTLAAVLSVAVAALTAHSAHISMAIGAFLAGMVIAESPWSHQVASDIVPFRDVFNSLFFISVGLMLSPTVIFAEPLTITALVLAAFFVKGIVAAGVTVLLGFGGRIGLLVAGSISQVGEFAFVLATEGLTYSLLSDHDHALFIAVSVITMLATPLAMAVGRLSAARLDSLDRFRNVLQPRKKTDATTESMRDHVIIVGYGINGSNVARVLRNLGVHHVVIELNARSIAAARDNGDYAIYGDAAREPVLKHASCETARVIVVAISDPAATRRITATARRLNPHVTLLVRTRFLHEVDALYSAGASHVVPEEFETSIELAGMVMETYGVPSLMIEREKDRFRDEAYRGLRASTDAHNDAHDDAFANATTNPGASTTERRPARAERSRSLASMLGEADVEEVRVSEELARRAPTLRELNLRARTGVTVIAVLRGSDIFASPAADFNIAAGDSLVLLGRADQMQQALLALRQPGTPLPPNTQPKTRDLPPLPDPETT